MGFCTKCGQKLIEGTKFCSSCGKKISKSNAKKESLKPIEYKTDIVLSPMLEAGEIKKINKKIQLKNNQSGIVTKAWYAAVFFALVILVAIMDFDGLPIHPAIVMLSIFFFIMSIIIGFMFRSREEKLQSLISGENLLAAWTLSQEQKKNYVNYLFKNEAGKNMIILFSIGAISIVVFGLFILFIEEGKLAMFLVLVGLLVFLSLFAFGMPFYYKMKNSKGDGNILIGAKYAYINGYFHNWDYMLSGLSKVKVMKTPFYGINLVYYYTDRTLSHSEALFIPANENEDLEGLIATLKEKNPKVK